MKFSLLFHASTILIFLFPACIINAQHTEPCGQSYVTSHWFAQKPHFEKEYQKSVQKIQKGLAHKETLKNSGTRSGIKYSIPVVFHILHLNGPENISDTQIHDQINILNRDYQKLNRDTANIVAPFKNNIANVGFEFKLATIDPYGNCTDGIIRHYTHKTNWDANKLEDFIYSWPSNQYLNIYIVKNINIAPAYTFLPGIGIPSNADAIVCQYNLVGSIGTASIANSRALTHEVGHWFGLPHIWGVSNAPGVICGDDFVDDTPLTKGFTSCSINNTRICDPQIEENVQNYMDYSPCKIMFTNGQAAYMHGTITQGINRRNILVSESNLIATGVKGSESCRTFANFYSAYSSICMGEKIKFYNQSKTGNVPFSMRWKIDGGIPSESVDSIVEVTFPDAGEFEVKLIISGANGVDSVSAYIQVYNGANGKKPPHQYSFDDGSLPSDIQIYNPAYDEIEWQVNPSLGANNTSSCLYLDNISGSDTPGKRDYFETRFFDFTNVIKPQFSFYYAYAKKNENQIDSFRVEYTLDCGQSWRSLPGIPNTNTMASLTGGTTTTPFAPITPAHWRKLTISSTFQALFKNKPSAKFRFYFKSDSNSDGSNNMYIDEINITDESISSILPTNDSDIALYPIPSQGEINLEVNAADYNSVHVLLKNMTDGGASFIAPENAYDSKVKYVINKNHELHPGVYYLIIKKYGYMDTFKKIVIIQ
jgi:predicted Zn-dependent protease